MNGVNKTLLPEGCPTKFKFEWSKTDAQTFTISLLDFTVGNMGMIINFKCDVKTMVLNSWEQKEYTGDGWIKFKGEDGSVWGTDTDGSASSAKGSSVQGYYNAKTHEIQFIVNYNMMNVRSECFLQTIDKNRINNYAAEFEQYEKTWLRIKGARNQIRDCSLYIKGKRDMPRHVSLSFASKMKGRETSHSEAEIV